MVKTRKLKKVVKLRINKGLPGTKIPGVRDEKLVYDITRRLWGHEQEDKFEPFLLPILFCIEGESLYLSQNDGKWLKPESPGRDVAYVSLPSSQQQKIYNSLFRMILSENSEIKGYRHHEDYAKSLIDSFMHPNISGYIERLKQKSRHRA